MPDVKCCLNGCFQVLPVSSFAPHPRSPDGLNSRCRACESARLSTRKHGLTAEEKTAIAEDQSGCAICGRTEPGGRGWGVDHDRSCCSGDKSCESCRRGVLCHWCNTALGYAGDDPERLRRMADYIEAGTRLAPASRTCDECLRIHTDEQDKRTQRSLTAVYLDTAVDAHARIKDSTSPAQQRTAIRDALHPTTAEEATT